MTTEADKIDTEKKEEIVQALELTSEKMTGDPDAYKKIDPVVEPTAEQYEAVNVKAALDKAELKIIRLENALKFYANERNYTPPGINPKGNAPIMDDCGFIAKSALDKLQLDLSRKEKDGPA